MRNDGGSNSGKPRGARSRLALAFGALGVGGSVISAFAENNWWFFMVAVMWLLLVLELPENAAPRGSHAIQSRASTPHLPCTNPTCGIPGHFPPVCDFCYSQPTHWEYRRSLAALVAVAWTLALMGMIIFVVLISVTAAGLLCGFLLILPMLPSHWLPGGKPIWYWLGAPAGRRSWEACDTCYSFIQSGNREALTLRTRRLVPAHLGMAGDVLPRSVVVRTEAFFSATTTPRQHRL